MPAPGLPDDAVLDASAILEAILEPVMVHDPVTGTVLWVNRTAIETVGIRPGDIPNDPAHAGHFLDRDGFRASDMVARIRKAHAEGPQVFLWRKPAPDGESVVEISLNPARLGNCEAVVAVLRDRTAQERQFQRWTEAERAVADISARFIDLDDIVLPEALGWACKRLGEALSGNGCHVYLLDEAATRLKRAARWNGPGIPYLPEADLFPASFLDQLRGLMEGGHALELRADAFPADASPELRSVFTRFCVGSCLLAPVAHHGLILGCLSVTSQPALRTWNPHESSLVRLAADALANVLVRHRHERSLRQRQKMDALGQLAGGVAHDFNNMLTGILGFADMLQTQLKDRPAAAETASRIADAAERAAELTRQLLAFARRGSRSRQTVDLHRVIEDTFALAERTLGRGVVLKSELLAPRAWVLGDATMLQSALLNMLLNARDAMPDGGTITVSTWDRNGELQLEVADTGIGMPPEVRERVFEPFFTTKGVGHGTGLGLAAVYGTVREHGGSIDVDSAPGAGTSFRIRLPMTVSPPTVRLQSSQGHHRTGRALVIDDEPSVRQATAEMLRSQGWEVVEAADGESALAQLAGPGVFAAAIVDLIMPRRDGGQVACDLRLRDPSLPVLFVSGYERNADLALLTSMPRTGFLSKPFRAADLAAAIGKLR